MYSSSIFLFVGDARRLVGSEKWWHIAHAVTIIRGYTRIERVREREIIPFRHHIFRLACGETTLTEIKIQTQMMVKYLITELSTRVMLTISQRLIDLNRLKTMRLVIARSSEFSNSALSNGGGRAQALNRT